MSTSPSTSAVRSAPPFAGVGRFGMGLVSDLIRFSPIRTWAISAVVVTQAIRRRVLFMAPLVLLLAIAVSQWQRPIDPQDAVRQTTAFCLLASGILVVMVSVLMSCTNLPKDIESRVIYTIATKPTTRLEIALGKILGLSRVTFYLLALIGLLTWGYLHLRDDQARRASEAKLAMLPKDDRASRPMLEYYRDQGTLHAREVRMPAELSVYASLPSGPEDRWISGTNDSELAIPVTIDRRLIPSVPQQAKIEDIRPKAAPLGPEFGPPKIDWAKPQQLAGGLCLMLPVKYRKSAEQRGKAATQPGEGSAPRVEIQFHNRFHENVVASGASQDLRKLPSEYSNVEWGVRFGLIPPPKDVNDPRTYPKVPPPPEGQGVVFVYLGQDRLEEWAPEGAVSTEAYVAVVGVNGDYEYTADARNLRIWAADTPPLWDENGRQMPTPIFGATGDASFAGRQGQHGQQLRGGPNSRRVAVMEFRNLDVQSGQERHAMEMRVALEGSAEDEGDNPEVLIDLDVELYNLKDNQVHKLGSLYPENHRPLYFTVPARAVEGGNFDVRLRLKTNGWLGLRAAGPKASLKLVQGNQLFAWNLAKSFLVLWLLSVLVIIVSVFCSTFLSWPIAVVLTLVILGGRWGAEQLMETVEKSAGRSVVDSIFNIRDPGAARVVSEGVDALVNTFQTFSMLLPDVTGFAAIQYIERGVAMPGFVIADSLLVLAIFGLPMTVLAWGLLRLKEVAP